MDVCRTCMCETSLLDIFANNCNDISEKINALYIVTGLKITVDDGFSQKMCTNCVDHLNKSLLFREKCKQVQIALLEIKSQLKTESVIVDQNTETFSDIEIGYKDMKIDQHTDQIKQEFNCKSLDDDSKPLTDMLGTEIHYKELYIQHKKIPKIKEKKLVKKNFRKINNTEKKHKETTKNIYNFEIKEELRYNNLEDEENHIVDESKQLKYFTGETEDNNKELFVKQLETDMKGDKDLNLVKNQKKERVTCKLCQKNLSVRSIDIHMARSHPGADKRRVKCDLCDNYIMKTKIKRHMDMMHGSGHHKCSYCKLEFDTQEVLVAHVVSCSAKKKKRHVSASSREMKECDVCHKKMQKASLRMHNAVKHAGLGPVCKYCSRRFGNKFRLDEHYRAKHGHEKFKCEECDFQSAGIMAMRNHQRRHRGEKPFVCESCGAQFHAAYLLAQHKHSHRTDKLVKCDLCPASFKANNSLHMHKLTCHSAALYRCTLCSRSYSCRHYAVKHLRHVHDYRGTVPPLERIPAEVTSECT